MPRNALPNVILPILALAGTGLAVVTVFAGTRAPQSPVVVDQPAQSAFAYSVSGTGLVEPGSEFIEVGTEVSGTVARVGVAAGQVVEAGEVLFTLDSRAAAAERAVRASELALAEATIARLRSAPRSEDLPPLKARVAAAEALLREAQSLLSLVERVGEGDASSPNEVARRRYLVEEREAAVREAKALLAHAEAGSWAEDIRVAEAERDAAAARLGAADVALELRTIRAPVAGTVLRVEVRPGEHVVAGGTPAIVLGSLDELLVRIDIDENEAWRVEKGARATASLRGNSSRRADLAFVRIEPYVIPKRSLTGLSTERVDTRVLQVIYSMRADALNAFPGQQVDVFIEAAQRNAEATLAPR
jgi:HlyD family secretion protein